MQVWLGMDGQLNRLVTSHGNQETLGSGVRCALDAHSGALLDPLYEALAGGSASAGILQLGA